MVNGGNIQELKQCGNFNTMRSFLLKEKKPILKWGQIPDEKYFEGEIPQGYQLAISPSKPYVILDIDRHGDVNGFDNIPSELLLDLSQHFCYNTKGNGRHIWLKYAGDKHLMNKSSGLGIDLRTEKGYVVWYLPKDIRSHLQEVKETSKELNQWLEKLFSNG